MTLRTPSRAARLPLRERIGLLVLGLLAPACEQRLPEFRYETEHLRIATDFDEPLCRGDLDHYESVITRLEVVLDTTVDEQTDVYLWDLTKPVPDWCSLENASGCYNRDEGALYADQASIGHELVHVVIASIGSPTAFWNEGAATSLQVNRSYFSEGKPSDNLDLEAPYLDYHAAGHFSRWLFETYGVELYRALLRAPGSSRAAFEQTYEMTIEQAQELYFAQAPYSYGAFMGCDDPELAQVGDGQWSETIDIDCDKPHVYGGPLGMAAHRVLTIAERGDYTFSTTAGGGVILACRDVDLDSAPVEDDPALGDVPPYDHHYLALRPFAGEGALTTFDLVPGRYEFGVGIPGDFEPRTVRIDVQATQP
jgi:hypothetical protein